MPLPAEWLPPNSLQTRNPAGTLKEGDSDLEKSLGSQVSKGQAALWKLELLLHGRELTSYVERNDEWCKTVVEIAYKAETQHSWSWIRCISSFSLQYNSDKRKIAGGCLDKVKGFARPPPALDTPATPMNADLPAASPKHAPVDNADKLKKPQPSALRKHLAPRVDKDGDVAIYNTPSIGASFLAMLWGS